MMTGRGRQQKGRAFELWVLKKEWEAMGKPWPWKNQRPDDGHSAPSPFDRYHQEMKRQEKLNLHQAVVQAREEARRTGKRYWAVLHKRNRAETVVTIDFNHWMELVTCCADGEEGKLGRLP